MVDIYSYLWMSLLMEYIYCHPYIQLKKYEKRWIVSNIQILQSMDDGYSESEYLDVRVAPTPNTRRENLVTAPVRGRAFMLIAFAPMKSISSKT